MKKDLENFNHLQWQCRRGMLELDEILLKFLHSNYLNLSFNLKLKFNELLKASDADLFDWFFNKSLISNNENKELINLITIIKKNSSG